MELFGGPLLTNPQYFCFRTSNVPWRLETEKNGTVKFTAENKLLPRIYKKAIFDFSNDK